MASPMKQFFWTCTIFYTLICQCKTTICFKLCAPKNDANVWSRMSGISSLDQPLKFSRPATQKVMEELDYNLPKEMEEYVYLASFMRESKIGKATKARCFGESYPQTYLIRSMCVEVNRWDYIHYYFSCSKQKKLVNSIIELHAPIQFNWNAHKNKIWPFMLCTTKDIIFIPIVFHMPKIIYLKHKFKSSHLVAFSTSNYLFFGTL